MQNKLVFTVGADPEFFVTEAGQPVSAHGLIPGTKAAPHQVRGGAVQVDGMALEINVNPARSRQEFITSVNDVMQSIRMFLPPHYQIATGLPVADFGLDYIMNQPPEASELGCTPDFNGWTGAANPTPDAMFPFRTASGHIHMGWGCDVSDPYNDKEHYTRACEMAKQMDYFVGIFTLLWDGDNRRRDLYGKAGAFRAKSYGIEYRVPSTAWLGNEELTAWIYDATVAAMEHFFREGDGLHSPMADMNGDWARSIIDNNDTEWYKTYEGQILFDSIGLQLPKVA